MGHTNSNIKQKVFCFDVICLQRCDQRVKARSNSFNYIFNLTLPGQTGL